MALVFKFCSVWNNTFGAWKLKPVRYPMSQWKSWTHAMNKPTWNMCTHYVHCISYIHTYIYIVIYIYYSYIRKHIRPLEHAHAYIKIPRNVACSSWIHPRFQQLYAPGAVAPHLATAEATLAMAWLGCMSCCMAWPAYVHKGVCTHMKHMRQYMYIQHEVLTNYRAHIVCR